MSKDSSEVMRVARFEGGLRLKGIEKSNLVEMPLVSVVTVVLNGAPHIEETMKSVLGQSYGNIEYIVIDGGSNDGTLDQVRKYEDRIDLWISEPDRGISDAFNKGISLSKGEIIGLINADDWYSFDAVERAVGAFKMKRECGFVFGGCAYYKKSGLVYVVSGDKDYKDSILYKMPSFNHPTVFVRASAYKDVGLFNIKWKLAMDYDWLLRAHKTGVVGCCIPGVVAHMRLGGVSDLMVKRSYVECYRISVANNGSKLKALIVLAGKMIKYAAKKYLERVE